jgi:hypothetical protein
MGVRSVSDDLIRLPSIADPCRKKPFVKTKAEAMFCFSTD